MFRFQRLGRHYPKEEPGWKTLPQFNSNPRTWSHLLSPCFTKAILPYNYKITPMMSYILCILWKRILLLRTRDFTSLYRLENPSNLILSWSKSNGYWDRYIGNTLEPSSASFELKTGKNVGTPREWTKSFEKLKHVSSKWNKSIHTLFC